MLLRGVELLEVGHCIYQTSRSSKLHGWKCFGYKYVDVRRTFQEVGGCKKRHSTTYPIEVTMMSFLYKEMMEE